MDNLSIYRILNKNNQNNGSSPSQSPVGNTAIDSLFIFAYTYNLLEASKNGDTIISPARVVRHQDIPQEYHLSVISSESFYIFDEPVKKIYLDNVIHAGGYWCIFDKNFKGIQLGENWISNAAMGEEDYASEIKKIIADGKTPHMMTFGGGGFLNINPVSFNSFGFQEHFAFDADGINRAPDD